jgi:uncharacterized membrane protein YgcG
MPITPHRFGAAQARTRIATAVALSVSLIALLAAIPTTSASASNAPKPSIEIPNGDLGSLLETLPISDLDLTNLELEEVLSRVGGLNQVGDGQLGTVVSSLLKGNPQATVGELVSSLLDQNAISGALKSLGLGLEGNQILQALNPEELSKLFGNLNGEDISKLLSGLAGNLNPEQLGSLQQILSAVVGGLSSSQVAKLQEGLQSALGHLSKGELKPVLETLQSLLSGSNLTQLQELLGKLGSLSPTQLHEQLEAVLGGLNTTQLSGLVDTLFDKLSSSQVETLLDDLLDGMPLSLTNGESLARELGTSVGGLGEQLGSTVTSGTPAITSGLGKEGPVLGLVDGVSGLKLGLLNGEKGNGGSGGNGGSSGEGTNTSQDGSSGGNGGSGGSEGTSPGGSETITVVLPATRGSGASSKATATKTAKIKIVSHKVKGGLATIVLQVPAAGRVTLSGAHVTKVARTVGKGERLTLKVKLTRAGTASLRRHRNLLRVVLKAYFAPKSGTDSSATTSVSFR